MQKSLSARCNNNTFPRYAGLFGCAAIPNSAKTVATTPGSCHNRWLLSNLPEVSFAVSDITLASEYPLTYYLKTFALSSGSTDNNFRGGQNKSHKRSEGLILELAQICINWGLNSQPSVLQDCVLCPKQYY